MASVSNNISNASYRIEILKGDSNYLVWKVKMEDILTDLNLVDYVEGRIVKPATDSSSWETNDRRALSAVRLRVSDVVIPYILTAKTSKEAWTTLRNRFEPRGTMAIGTRLRRLLSTRWEEGMDIMDFIYIMLGHRNQLTILLGRPMSEDEFSLLILIALGESWDSFISTIKDSELLDSRTIIKKVIAHSSPNEIALAAKSGKSDKKKSRVSRVTIVKGGNTTSNRTVWTP